MQCLTYLFRVEPGLSHRQRDGVKVLVQKLTTQLPQGADN